jgi:hypothetical protein
VVSELVEKRLMEEVLYVLGVVEGSGGSGSFRDLLLVAGLSGVNAWEGVSDAGD